MKVSFNHYKTFEPAGEPWLGSNFGSDANIGQTQTAGGGWLPYVDKFLNVVNTAGSVVSVINQTKNGSKPINQVPVGNVNTTAGLGGAMNQILPLGIGALVVFFVLKAMRVIR